MSEATNPTETGAKIRPFQIEVPQADLDELQERLARTRWPDELPGVGAGYGVQLGHLKDFHDHGHAHRRADLSTFGCVVRDGVRSARLGGGGLDPRHPQELRTRSKRGESRMKFVGLDYGLQPRSLGVLSRTSAVVQHPVVNRRIDFL